MSGSSPDSPPVDLSRIEAVAKGDQEFAREIAQIFLADAPVQIARIEVAAKGSDPAGLETCAGSRALVINRVIAKTLSGSKRRRLDSSMSANTPISAALRTDPLAPAIGT